MVPVMRLLAEKVCDKGDILIDQEPFCFLQTSSSRRSSFCCMHCARYLGDLDAQLLRAKGSLQRPTEFIANVHERFDSTSISADYSPVLMCKNKGCKSGYCSEAC